ncbi:MAG: hypothetical protein AAFQ80_07105 [Cyanobacteria bacterium J06621_8]
MEGQSPRETGRNCPRRIRAEESSTPLRIRIADSLPKVDPNAASENVRNTGEYFSVQVMRGNEVLEEFPNLTMQPEPDTSVAD